MKQKVGIISILIIVALFLASCNSIYAQTLGHANKKGLSSSPILRISSIPQLLNISTDEGMGDTPMPTIIPKPTDTVPQPTPIYKEPTPTPIPVLHITPKPTKRIEPTNVPPKSSVLDGTTHTVSPTPMPVNPNKTKQMDKPASESKNATGNIEVKKNNLTTKSNIQPPLLIADHMPSQNFYEQNGLSLSPHDTNMLIFTGVLFISAGFVILTHSFGIFSFRKKRKRIFTPGEYVMPGKVRKGFL